MVHGKRNTSCAYKVQMAQALSPEPDESNSHTPNLYPRYILILSSHKRLGLPRGLSPFRLPAMIPGIADNI
jgi:hypothetical protein